MPNHKASRMLAKNGVDFQSRSHLVERFFHAENPVVTWQLLKSASECLERGTIQIAV
jgi:hypothetical protein